MKTFLALIRDKTDGNKPDMWIMDRLELGFKHARRLAAAGKDDEALSVFRIASNCLKKP